MGSSIASNLASARGIPLNKQRKSTQAPLPAVTQQNAEGSIVPPHRRSYLTQPPKLVEHDKEVSEKPSAATVQPLPAISQAPSESKEEAPLPPVINSDQPFNRFYSTYEAFREKLSAHLSAAPLAFGGFPLSPNPEKLAKESPTQAQNQADQTAMQKAKPKSQSNAPPDYSSIFSPAITRVIGEYTDTSAVIPTESFYHVPPTGEMASYASMFAHRTQQHPEGILRSPTNAEQSEFFVDAQERPANGPRSIQKFPPGAQSASGKTLEELELENWTLKLKLDETARRLWRFEASSQLSNQALHQSIRASLKSSPSASVAGGVLSAESEARQKALEKEIASVKRENEKLKDVVGKYRERWDKLKEGAKMRREATGPEGSEIKQREE